MIAESVKQQAKLIDLFSLASRDTQLRKIASTRGGEFAGPCPRCGGTDRFHVQPEAGIWMCRQCHPEWGDVIEYARWRDGIDFAEAVRRLTGGSLSNDFKPASKVQHHEAATPPCAQWQARAEKFIAWSEAQLWADAGALGRDYLHGRGFLDDTLKTWRIGYNLKAIKDRRANWGLSDSGLSDSGSLWLPTGVVIPGIVAGAIWYVKVRNLKATGHGDKYPQVPGSQPALYGAHTLGKHAYAVITEGEFDALITWQSLQHASNPEWHTIGVATLGSAEKNLDVDTWSRYLWPVQQLLVCMDNDASGKHGTDKWLKQFNNARQMCLPSDVHDLNDYHTAGGRILDLVTYEIVQERWNEKPAAGTDLVGQLETDWRTLQGGSDDEAVLGGFLMNLERYERIADRHIVVTEQ